MWRWRTHSDTMDGEPPPLLLLPLFIFFSGGQERRVSLSSYVTSENEMKRGNWFEHIPYPREKIKKLQNQTIKYGGKKAARNLCSKIEILFKDGSCVSFEICLMCLSSLKVWGTDSRSNIIRENVGDKHADWRPKYFDWMK